MGRCKRGRLSQRSYSKLLGVPGVLIPWLARCGRRSVQRRRQACSSGALVGVGRRDLYASWHAMAFVLCRASGTSPHCGVLCGFVPAMWPRAVLCGPVPFCVTPHLLCDPAPHSAVVLCQTRHAMSCDAKLRRTTPRHATPCHTTPQHTTPHHTAPHRNTDNTPCQPNQAMSCQAMPWHDTPCHAMPFHAISCHFMPCHAMPCHAMRMTMECHMPC